MGDVFWVNWDGVDFIDKFFDVSDGGLLMVDICFCWQ